MLTIKVLGPGCQNCQTVADKAKEALEAVAESQPEDFEATVVKVTQTEEFMKYGLLYTPGLVVNEKLVSAGRIPEVKEITGWLQAALATPAQ
jgi:small redox-active disulfide protein 2